MLLNSINRKQSYRILKDSSFLVIKFIIKCFHILLSGNKKKQEFVVFGNSLFLLYTSQNLGEKRTYLHMRPCVGDSSTLVAFSLAFYLSLYSVAHWTRSSMRDWLDGLAREPPAACLQFPVLGLQAYSHTSNSSYFYVYVYNVHEYVCLSTYGHRCIYGMQRVDAYEGQKMMLGIFSPIEFYLTL